MMRHMISFNIMYKYGRPVAGIPSIDFRGKIFYARNATRILLNCSIIGTTNTTYISFRP